MVCECHGCLNSTGLSGVGSPPSPAPQGWVILKGLLVAPSQREHLWEGRMWFPSRLLISCFCTCQLLGKISTRRASMAARVPSLTDTLTAKCGLLGQKFQPEIAGPESWGFQMDTLELTSHFHQENLFLSCA